MISSVDQLLDALGWPASAGRHPGTLTWTKNTEEGPLTRVFIASVVLTRNSLICRLRSARVSRPWQLSTHIEAVWDISISQPYLMKWVVDGEARSAFSETAFESALADFKNAVTYLGVDPQLYQDEPLGTQKGTR